jgi:hypothetical protein
MRCGETNPASASSYQAALDDIYSTFMAVKHRIKGRFDRDTRQPLRLFNIARDRNIIPPPARIIKVSGSKGKGTTARMAARILQTRGQTVGLFVSPEEVDHFDRMRINGVAMTPEQFVWHYGQLEPQLQRIKGQLQGDEYLSPLGIFLLIALNWFKHDGADYLVLETGRGVQHDEVGQIPAKVGILTSIMLEHADKLGPDLGDIARDKLSLCDTCQTVIAADNVAAAARVFAPARIPALRTIKPRPMIEPTMPSWLYTDADLATAAVNRLLDHQLPDAPLDLTDASASFGNRTISSHTYTFEALIHTESLDSALLDQWQRDGVPTDVVASFPDDKDREHLLAVFAARGWRVTECVLTGTRGYLDYSRTTADDSATRVTFAYDDAAGFAAWLATRPARPAIDRQPSRTYLAGTQTYIRLVRNALTIMAKTGGGDADR